MTWIEYLTEQFKFNIPIVIIVFLLLMYVVGLESRIKKLEQKWTNHMKAMAEIFDRHDKRRKELDKTS